MSEQLHRQEAETLRETLTSLVSTLNLEQVLDNILSQLDRIVQYDSTSVLLLEGDTLRLVAGRGFPDDVREQVLGQRFPASNALMVEIRHTKRPIFIDDVYEDNRFQAWGGATYIRGWMGIPLITQGKVIGLLTVDNRRVGAYRENETLLAQAFANQAAIAIQNAQLFQATRRSAEELQVVSTILHILNARPAADKAFPEVAAVLKQTTGSARISLLLLEKSQEGGTVVLLDEVSKEGLLGQGAYVRLIDCACAPDVYSGCVHLTPDLAAETDYLAEQMLYQAGYRSRINLPLSVGEQIIGSLNLAWLEINGYDLTQVPLLKQIANAIALAIERSRLFEETRRHTAELEAVAAASAALRAAHSVEEMLPIILKKATEVVVGTLGSIYLVEPDTGDLVERGSYPPTPRLSGRRFQPGQGIIGHVGLTGELHISPDLAHDPLAHFLAQEADILQLVRSSISLPLRAQDHIVGVMDVSLAEVHTFNETEVRLLTAISEIAGSALDRAMVLETLEQRVTERTRELAAANEQLKELDRLKTKFVSDVSHELRTPITNLGLYLDLLARGPSEKREHYLSVLRGQTARLANLIEAILSLSRFDMGKVTAVLSPIDLNKLVNEVVAVQLPNATAMGLALTVNLQSDLPLIDGESSQLTQVIMNLLANAINYTPAGEIQVSTGWNRSKAQVCLTIRDTGIGIDPGDRPYLFDRFYRGRFASQSNIPGAGLGLAIVKEIVHLHQGQIEVQSQVGVGTTFCIWLPVPSTR